MSKFRCILMWFPCVLLVFSRWSSLCVIWLWHVGGWSRGSYRPWNANRGTRGRYWLNWHLLIEPFKLHCQYIFIKLAVCTLCRRRPYIARCFWWSDNGRKNIFYCIVFSFLCCWMMQPCVDRPRVLSVLDMWEKYTTKCWPLVLFWFCCCILLVHRQLKIYWTLSFSHTRALFIFHLKSIQYCTSSKVSKKLNDRTNKNHL